MGCNSSSPASSAPSKISTIHTKEMANADQVDTFKWKDGYWYNYNERGYLLIIKGDKSEYKGLVCLDYPESKVVARQTWRSGEFEPAHPDIVEATGVKNYNIEIDNEFFKQYGVLNKEGTEIKVIGVTKKVESLKWMSDEELEKIKEDREPADAPSISYFEPKPDQQGKLFWFSGKKLHSEDALA